MLLDKLITVNPSENHNVAWSLHEPQTSKWITRSEEWKSWSEGNLKLWWIHAIPGAGKTVLASYLIEETKRICRESMGVGFAYYHCHHTRTHHTETEPFLRWVVSELSRQAEFVPPAVMDDRHQLGIQSLTDAFATLAQLFEVVYIVMDALDECRNREGFLKFIKHINASPAFENVRFLITSREETDIIRVFAPISTQLSMTDPLVDEDIHDYIHSQLTTDPAFEAWPEDLRQEIGSALTAGAGGM